MWVWVCVAPHAAAAGDDVGVRRVKSERRQVCVEGGRRGVSGRQGGSLGWSWDVL